MTPAEFDAVFDEGWQRAFRLETQRVCEIPDEARRVKAFRAGTARPIRSVRTDPWMARIARTSDVALESPKLWQHAMILDHPLTPYQEYRLVGLTESQAAGEEVWIMPRDGEEWDFWLFDDSFAVLLDYDDEGRFVDAERTADRAWLATCKHIRDHALAVSVPLNEYLASGRLTRAA